MLEATGQQPQMQGSIGIPGTPKVPGQLLSGHTGDVHCPNFPLVVLNQPHLGLTAILEPRDSVSPLTHWSERGMVPKGKAGAAATKKGIGLGQREALGLLRSVCVSRCPE